MTIFVRSRKWSRLVKEESVNNDLHGEPAIIYEHVQNNQTVRQMLGQRGIKPEELPPAEDIKKLERKVARDEKMIAERSQKLPKN